MYALSEALERKLLLKLPFAIQNHNGNSTEAGLCCSYGPSKIIASCINIDSADFYFYTA